MVRNLGYPGTTDGASNCCVLATSMLALGRQLGFGKLGGEERSCVMRTTVLSAVLLAAAVASPCFAQQWAEKMFDAKRHDFGTIARSAKAEYEFTFKNIYVEDVHIASARPSCGCTSVRLKGDRSTYKTYETGAVIAHINSDKFLVTKGATITVTIDRPFRAEVQLQVSAYIRSDVVLDPGSVEFGTVDQGTPAEQTIEVSIPANRSLQITEVKSNSPYLQASLSQARRDWQETSYQLKVRLDPRTPPGYVNDHLMLVTNDYRRTQIPVPVEGSVLPAIAVSPNWLLFGVLEPGQKAVRQVVVRGKTPFRITGMTAEGGGFAFDLKAAQEPKRLHVVPVTFVAGDQAGKLTRRIHVETDRGGATADLYAQAVVEGTPSGTVLAEHREEVKPSGQSPSGEQSPPTGQNQTSQPPATGQNPPAGTAPAASAQGTVDPTGLTQTTPDPPAPDAAVPDPPAVSQTGQSASAQDAAAEPLLPGDRFPRLQRLMGATAAGEFTAAGGPGGQQTLPAFERPAPSEQPPPPQPGRIFGSRFLGRR
jgi:hypothetical protein